MNFRTVILLKKSRVSNTIFKYKNIVKKTKYLKIIIIKK